MAEFNRRFSKGLQFTSSYAWSKNLANGEGSAPGSFSAENGGGRVLDRFNLRGDYGDVSFTRRHRSLTSRRSWCVSPRHRTARRACVVLCRS